VNQRPAGWPLVDPAVIAAACRRKADDDEAVADAAARDSIMFS